MEFVILTMSSKNKGYCVAGIDLNNGQFARLVLDKSGSAIPKHYMKSLKPLDAIELQVLESVPEACQTENIIVDWSSIKRIGSLSIDQVLQIHRLDEPTYLFENEKRFLWESEALSLNYSLLLVQVYHMTIHTELGATHVQTKADFTYNGIDYFNISITDRDYYNQNQVLESAVIVMSIPNKRMMEDNECYVKFIAKIF